MLSRRRLFLLALLAAGACQGSSSSTSSTNPNAPPGSDPSTPSTPSTPTTPTTPTTPGDPGTPSDPGTPADTGPVVVGTGNGKSALSGSSSGAAAIAIDVDRGLYVLDVPLAGEPSLEGEVYVTVNGATPPADTTVEINGVALARRELPGSPQSPFRIDVSGPQPQPGPDGMVTITVRTGGLVKTMSLPCPPDVALTCSQAPDSNLRGKRTLDMSWAEDLEPNTENPFPTAFGTSAKLMHYSYATHAVGDEHYSTKYVPAGTTTVSLDVAPSDDGYCAELRWQGKFFQDGSSRGFCGRAKRVEYHY
jgi:hypothetical protein